MESISLERRGGFLLAPSASHLRKPGPKVRASPRLWASCCSSLRRPKAGASCNRALLTFITGFFLALLLVGGPRLLKEKWARWAAQTSGRGADISADLSAQLALARPVESQLRGSDELAKILEKRLDDAARQDSQPRRKAAGVTQVERLGVGGTAEEEAVVPRTTFEKLAVPRVPAVKRRPCPAGCEENGTCNEEIGRCDCPGHLSGPSCSDKAMPGCWVNSEMFTACHEPASCRCFQDCEKKGIIHWPICYSAEVAPAGNTTAFYLSPQKRITTDWRGNVTGSEDVTPGWEYRALPIHLCPKSCNLQGWCREDRTCVCRPGFAGRTCNRPVSKCLNSCSNRGKCVEGMFCQCLPNAFGIDCSLSFGPGGIPQVWTGPKTRAPKRRKGQHPKIYVYELPPEMNVWLGMHMVSSSFGPQYHEPILFLERLLHSKFRTMDATSADYFFVPIWLKWHGLRELYVQAAVHYVQTHWPFWNATMGRRHLFIDDADHGTCEGAPHRIPLLRNSTVLSFWGYSLNAHGGPQHPCFVPGLDVAIPPLLKEGALQSSPHLAGARSAKSAAARDTLFFFAGFSGRGGGVPDTYSFGVRQMLFNLWFNRSDIGFVVEEADERLLDLRMLTSVFCFAPAGTGYGTRAQEAVILGCIPVIVQDRVVQPLGGDLLDWDEIGVVLTKGDLQRLPEILQGISSEERQRKFKKLEEVWQHLVWTGPSLPPLSQDAVPDSSAWADKLSKNDVFSSVMKILGDRVLASNAEAA